MSDNKNVASIPNSYKELLSLATLAKGNEPLDPTIAPISKEVKT